MVKLTQGRGMSHLWTGLTTGLTFLVSGFWGPFQQNEMNLVWERVCYSLSWCVGSPLQWLLLLRSMGSCHVGFSSGSVCVGSVVVARGL